MRDFWQRIAVLDPVPEPRQARAAVLVALYEDDEGATRVVLTRRPDWMRTHPGDVVFPGGRIERGETVVETAIREAEEEIGLDPGSVEVLGGLTAVTTRDPRNLIVPVVARVERPHEYVLEESEVAAVLEPKMIDLLDDGNWRTSRWLGRTMWFYDFPQGTMWGATAFMMRALIDHVRLGAPPDEPPPDIEIRTMQAGDLEHVRRALYLAAAWSPNREVPSQEIVLSHEYFARYHEDWGRAGDVGVVAFAGDRFLGAAYGRLFTEDDHGHGFVDPQTPEITIAVEPGHRGEKLGSRLLSALETVAAAEGVGALSLSVELDNPARRLYERFGYEELDSDDTAVRMVRTIPPERVTFSSDRTQDAR
jgi:8-oxo-dGTP pyrophosphatase MutT (NUDIX family)/ribosomal protein S18 acetylase RimI-like enzyme